MLAHPPGRCVYGVLADVPPARVGLRGLIGLIGLMVKLYWLRWEERGAELFGGE